jgi:hypothetical protein
MQWEDTTNTRDVDSLLAYKMLFLIDELSFLTILHFLPAPAGYMTIAQTDNTANQIIS